MEDATKKNFRRFAPDGCPPPTFKFVPAPLVLGFLDLVFKWCTAVFAWNAIGIMLTHDHDDNSSCFLDRIPFLTISRGDCHIPCRPHVASCSLLTRLRLSAIVRPVWGCWWHWDIIPGVRPVADPKILKKEDTIFHRRRHLSQMPIVNYKHFVFALCPCCYCARGTHELLGQQS